MDLSRDETLTSSCCSPGKSKYDLEQKTEGYEYSGRNGEKIAIFMLNYKVTDERDYAIL